MLTGKQKRFLRAEAHHLDPIFQVGKGGISEAMLVQIKQALNVRELIKVRILDNCEFDKKEVAADLAEGSSAELVQLIGLTVVLYKEATKREYRKIELPRAK
ncbi:MAG: ribosome assembly RNA-binding protein YhbY [Kurthia sp.]|uniref:RNA-binding protein n=1 Tax=Kurthia zopfii TaxID=1650 RepID=A0A2U3AHL3_9BACL|nr:ribosome assembly RNA-binding protein YhbY [Kurthia zopfii]PWI24052.1 ribosome assembly RNA-binding protein YhbY [Kurthia zopfii]TDR44307.1 RNA-binding protein [Kurthia zopfii]STX10087.1 RNA-binding protein HI_1333 [Kurthia zopfii]VEI07803.1 RNA-binding protein HI_1333 [Kurthia zopfii]GEK29737.1 RNA-binding protein [Kurthia zopfii]